MICPNCKENSCFVSKTNSPEEGITIRLKKCRDCGHSWRTVEKDDWLLYKEKMTGEGYDYAPATEPYISYKGTVVASIVAHYPIPYRRLKY